MALTFATATIASTGVAQRLSATALLVSSVVIQARGGDQSGVGANTAKVHVGPSTVTTSGTTGVQIGRPEAGYTPPSVEFSSGNDDNVFDLSTIYICGTAGDGVNLVYHTV